MSGRSRQQHEVRGRWAETVAAWWLRLKGYRVLDRRVRTPVGEVDIVAARGNRLAFVEVKLRASHVLAAECLTPHALLRVRRASAALAFRYPGNWQEMTIDAVLVAPWRLPRHLHNLTSE